MHLSAFDFEYAFVNFGYNVPQRLMRSIVYILNALKLKQHCRHFPDDIFKCIFLNGKACISLSISMKFVFS